MLFPRDVHAVCTVVARFRRTFFSTISTHLPIWTRGVTIARIVESIVCCLGQHGAINYEIQAWSSFQGREYRA